MRRAVVGLLGLSCAVGCSSSYEPARSPRITTVMDGGSPTFVKDGERIGAVGFGGGLADAVHDNPRAEHEARVGHNLVVAGFVLDIAGLGAEIGAAAATARQSASDQASGVALGLALGGLAAVITGSVMLIAGQPHIYDAVNIYNDGVDFGLRQPPVFGPRASAVAPPAVVSPAVAPPAAAPAPPLPPPPPPPSGSSLDFSAPTHVGK